MSLVLSLGLSLSLLSCAQRPVARVPLYHDLSVLKIQDDGNLSSEERQKLQQLSHRIRKEHPTVIVYIHGWKNNGELDNSNVQGFQRGLQRVYDRHFQEKKRQLIGVYLAWNAQRLPGLLDNAAYYKTRSVADRIATGPAMPEIIRTLSSAASSRGKEKLAFTGHSMGGRILGRVIARNPELLERTDLVFMVNAAEDVNSARKTMAAIPASQPHHARSTAKNPMPRAVWVTSKADFATRVIFPCVEGSKAVGHSLPDLTHTFDNRFRVYGGDVLEVPERYRNARVTRALISNHGDIWRDSVVTILNYCLWPEPNKHPMASLPVPVE